MKKVTLIAIATIFTMMSYAQGKYPSPQDSVTCVTNISLYRDYYKQKMYDDAYKFWRIVYTTCPKASQRMYVDGVTLMSKRIKAATKEQKPALIDSLFGIYDNRIANFGREGFVLGRKGTDMLRYRSSDLESVYNTLNKSVELQGDKSEAGALVAYMNTLVKMEKKELKTAEDVVTGFGTASGYVSHNIAKYEGKKTQQYYKKAEESIGNLASPYLSCEVLIEMSEKNFEKNKEDNAWLERTANILDKKGCTDAPVFFNIAKKMHSTSPSAVSAEKMGIMSLKTKKYDDAVGFFQQAIELNQDENKLADYHVELAQAYSSKGAYSKARTHARKAAGLRKGFGLPYLMIGDMIAGSASACNASDACIQKAIYWLATDYYAKAKAIDPSLASKANAKIASYKKYFPTKEDCFFGGTKEGDTVQIGCWIGESTKARF